MPAALYTLSYEDFMYYYRVFCRERGKGIPADLADRWEIAVDSWRVDLHQLYEACVELGGLDEATPAAVWDLVGWRLAETKGVFRVTINIDPEPCQNAAAGGNTLAKAAAADGSVSPSISVATGDASAVSAAALNSISGLLLREVYLLRLEGFTDFMNALVERYRQWQQQQQVQLPAPATAATVADEQDRAQMTYHGSVVNNSCGAAAAAATDSAQPVFWQQQDLQQQSRKQTASDVHLQQQQQQCQESLISTEHLHQKEQHQSAQAALAAAVTAAAAAANSGPVKSGGSRAPVSRSTAVQGASGASRKSRLQHSRGPGRLSAVDDLIPGDMLRSAVSWVRGASLELAGPADDQASVTSMHQALADRYSDITARIQSRRQQPLPEELYENFGVKQTRRSGRVRTQAVFYNPAPLSSGSDSEPENPWVIKEGKQYQADIPSLQPLSPNSPTAAEAKFLSAPLYVPQEQQQQLRRSPSFAAMMSLGSLPASAAAAAAASSLAGGGHEESSGALHPTAPQLFSQQYQELSGDRKAQLALLDKWLHELDRGLGPQLVQAFGLTLLGAKLRSTWTQQEEILFCLGMLEKYRSFRHIQRRYLPKRTVHELNGYYYNVWKNLAGEVPQAYAAALKVAGDSSVMELFRLNLTKQLADIWDEKVLGPVPPCAALPADAAVRLAAAEAAQAAGKAVGEAAAAAAAAVAAFAARSRGGTNSRGSTPVAVANATGGAASGPSGARAPSAAAADAIAASGAARLHSVARTGRSRGSTPTPGVLGAAAAAAAAAGSRMATTAAAAPPPPLPTRTTRGRSATPPGRQQAHTKHTSAAAAVAAAAAGGHVAATTGSAAAARGAGSTQCLQPQPCSTAALPVITTCETPPAHPLQDPTKNNNGNLNRGSVGDCQSRRCSSSSSSSLHADGGVGSCSSSSTEAAQPRQQQQRQRQRQQQDQPWLLYPNATGPLHRAAKAAGAAEKAATAAYMYQKQHKRKLRKAAASAAGALPPEPSQLAAVRGVLASIIRAAKELAREPTQWGVGCAMEPSGGSSSGQQQQLLHAVKVMRRAVVDVSGAAALATDLSSLTTAVAAKKKHKITAAVAAAGAVDNRGADSKPAVSADGARQKAETDIAHFALAETSHGAADGSGGHETAVAPAAGGVKGTKPKTRCSRQQAGQPAELLDGMAMSAEKEAAVGQAAIAHWAEQPLQDSAQQPLNSVKPPLVKRRQLGLNQGTPPPPEPPGPSSRPASPLDGPAKKLKLMSELVST